MYIGLSKVCWLSTVSPQVAWIHGGDRVCATSTRASAFMVERAFRLSVRGIPGLCRSAAGGGVLAPRCHVEPRARRLSHHMYRFTTQEILFLAAHGDGAIAL